MVALGLGEEEFEEKYHIRFTRDDELTNTVVPKIPLRSRLDQQANSENNSEIDSLLKRACNQIQLKEKKINCGVWELIHQVYPQELMPEYQTHLEEINAEANDKDQQITLSPTETGSIVHEILEKIEFSNLPDKPQLDQLLEPTPLSPGQVASVSNKLLSWFTTEEAGIIKEASNILNETPFSLKLSHGDTSITMNGIIDLVVEFPDGSYWLLDYKYARTKESPQYELQMLIYSMVLKKAYGKLPEKCFLAYLKNSENKEVVVDDSRLKEAESLIWNAIAPADENDSAQRALF